MEAIRTEYNGIGFRSKTEAKWAVLFDRLGIVYEYERRSFEFCGGEWYLPDFFLPDAEAFLDVKGESITELAVRKMTRLIYCEGGVGLILLGTPCDFRKYRDFRFAFSLRELGEGGPLYVKLYRLGRFIEDVLHCSVEEFGKACGEEVAFGDGGSRSGDVSHYDYTMRECLERVGVEWQWDTEGFLVTPAVLKLEHVSLDLPYRFHGSGR